MVFGVKRSVGLKRVIKLLYSYDTACFEHYLLIQDQVHKS